MIELKICLATLSLYLFFDEVPQEVDGFEPKEFVTIQPEKCYISPKKWSEIAE
jgi:hypothetical protein